MYSQRPLPNEFSQLAPYADWALPSETLRRQKREASEMDEITEFYNAVLPLADDIFEYFRRKETEAGQDDLDIETKNLFLLMLAFADASLSVEIHKAPSVPDGMPGDIWRPEHETAGWKNKPKIVLNP